MRSDTDPHHGCALVHSRYFITRVTDKTTRGLGTRYKLTGLQHRIAVVVRMKYVCERYAHEVCESAVARTGGVAPPVRICVRTRVHGRERTCGHSTNAQTALPPVNGTSICTGMHLCTRAIPESCVAETRHRRRSCQWLCLQLLRADLGAP